MRRKCNTEYRMCVWIVNVNGWTLSIPNKAGEAVGRARRFMCLKRIFTSHPPSSKTRYKFTQQWTFMVAACCMLPPPAYFYFLLYFIPVFSPFTLQSLATCAHMLSIKFASCFWRLLNGSMRPHRFYFNFCFHRIIWWKSFYRWRRVTAVCLHCTLDFVAMLLRIAFTSTECQ